jgi:hypothetical protein
MARNSSTHCTFRNMFWPVVLTVAGSVVPDRVASSVADALLPSYT